MNSFLNSNVVDSVSSTGKYFVTKLRVFYFIPNKVQISFIHTFSNHESAISVGPTHHCKRANGQPVCYCMNRDHEDTQPFCKTAEGTQEGCGVPKCKDQSELNIFTANSLTLVGRD